MRALVIADDFTAVAAANQRHALLFRLAVRVHLR
jgi:hypothetical protein